MGKNLIRLGELSRLLYGTAVPDPQSEAADSRIAPTIPNPPKPGTTARQAEAPLDGGLVAAANGGESLPAEHDVHPSTRRKAAA